MTHQSLLPRSIPLVERSVSDDENTPIPPDESDLDSEFDAEAIDDLPGVIQSAVKSAAAIPGTARQLSTWIPALSAAWRAGGRAVALSAAIREQLDDDEALQWPEELVGEFMETLREFGDTLPSIEEAIPIATDLLKLGDEHLGSETTQAIVLDILSRLEVVAERAVGRLLDAAFFASNSADQEQKTKDLLNFFLRLEDIFDRALDTWLSQQQPARRDS